MFLYINAHASLTLGEPEYEICDKGFIRIYERSRYLDYIKAHSLIYEIQSNVIHWCVLLEDDIIEVISGKQPTLYERIDDF